MYSVPPRFRPQDTFYTLGAEGGCAAQADIARRGLSPRQFERLVPDSSGISTPAWAVRAHVAQVRLHQPAGLNLCGRRRGAKGGQDAHDQHAFCRGGYDH
jgi:hypothetical protein